ncbi:MAG: sugar O-acyltransferase [Butyricimonas synergistica]|nr:MAG: sugar O-acyltransferase [Butyricimonas synergistica]
MGKKVIIIGGEGNGGVIAACIEDNRNRYNDLEWEVAGFVNDYEEQVCGYPVVGKLSDIPTLLKDPNNYFIWGIHLVGRAPLTERLFKESNIPTERFATIVHHSAFIGKDVVLEPGVFVMSNTYIGPRARIGMCSLVMANCSIGHNIKMGPLCHCSVGSIMTGYSEMGLCCDIAVGSTILAYKKIGNYAMLGAASLATHDIPDYEIHIGSPAKFLKRMKED